MVTLTDLDPNTIYDVFVVPVLKLEDYHGVFEGPRHETQFRTEACGQFCDGE